METTDVGALVVLLASWPTTRAAKPKAVKNVKKRMVSRSVRNAVKVLR